MNRVVVDHFEKIGKIAWERNLTPGISGNISVRVDRGIIITSSGASNGFLTEDEMTLIDMNGEWLEGNEKPSSEKFLHLEFYKKRPDIMTVFHFHSPYLTAFASTKNIELNLNASPEMIYCFEKIPIAKYFLPGSKELVKEMSQYFEKYKVILMANHGVIAGGSNMMETLLTLELCESYAKMLIESKKLGETNFLNEQEVEKIRSLKN